MLTTVHDTEIEALPKSLWSSGSTDVGLIKHVDPIKVKVTSDRRPMKPQYPLSAEARDGIRPVIADMEKAGILIRTTKTTCNTPIFTVKKASTGKYKLVHDLRAINDITEQIPPVVANPHTILNQVSPREQWFSVIDLSNAFSLCPCTQSHRDFLALLLITKNTHIHAYRKVSKIVQHCMQKRLSTQCPPAVCPLQDSSCFT